MNIEEYEHKINEGNNYITNQNEKMLDTDEEFLATFDKKLNFPEN